MRLSQAWIITSKDLSIFRKKKSIFYSVIIFPLFVSIGLPLLIYVLLGRSASIFPDARSGLLTVMNAFAFFFIIGAGSLPTAIASYSIIGKKQGQSLEPLLATPTTDSEILLGKSIGALLPPLVAIWIGGVIFMGLIDAITFGLLGYLYYPNAVMAVIMLLLVPLAAVTAVEGERDHLGQGKRCTDRTATRIPDRDPLCIALRTRRDKCGPAYSTVSPHPFSNYPGRRHRAFLSLGVHIPERRDPHKVEMKLFKKMRETARDLPTGAGKETQKMTSDTLPSKCSVQRNLAREKSTVPYATGKRILACPEFHGLAYFVRGGE